MTDHRGDTVPESVQFLVPAEATATFTHHGNWMRERYGSMRSDRTVTVTVMGIATVDGNGDPVTYETDDPTVTVDAPPAP